MTERMTEKKTPARKCVGCGAMFDRSLLIRVVRSKDGAVKADPTGKEDGRGAYICKNPACYRAARKRKAFEHAFSGRIPEEVFGELERICLSPEREEV